MNTKYNEFVKNHPDFYSEAYTEKDLEKIAEDFINSKNRPKNESGENTTKKTYWLVFDDNTGNNEDCNVFYSRLVYCRTKKEALTIIAANERRKNLSNLDARPMKLHTINTMNNFFLNK